MDDYHACEGLAKSFIFNTVVDTLLLKIQILPTSKEVWAAICKEYKDKPLMVQVDLRHHLHSTKCTQNSEVHAHLDLMVSTCEKLAGMGTEIKDEEFIQIILTSLPDKGANSYSIFLSAITASMGLSTQR